MRSIWKRFSPHPPPTDRVTLLTRKLRLEGQGLEIGPLHNPAVAKAESRVLYADHLPTAQLRAKYEADGFPDVSGIHDVDIVVGEAGLAHAVGDRRFSYVIASHVIEHVPDPVRWLEDIHSILEPDGVLSLAIPDKRYCFDRLRQTTTATQWIDAWLHRRSRPSPSNVLDALLNEVALDGAITWKGDVDSSALRHLTHPREALRRAADVARQDIYRDVHCWVFTPASFFLLLRQLCVFELFDFIVEGFHDTVGHEFFVRLRKVEDPDWTEQMGSIPLFREERYARIPGDFCPRDYLRAHPDVANAKVDPAEHYLEYGRAEGRQLR